MPTKIVTMSNAEGLLTNGARTAMLVTATQYDGFRRESDEWLPAWSNWAHGEAVDAVRHFDQHETALGDILALRSFTKVEIVQRVQIDRIQMIDLDEITEEVARDLGHLSLEDFRQSDDSLRGKYAWLMHFQRIDN